MILFLLAYLGGVLTIVSQQCKVRPEADEGGKDQELHRDRLP
jgi:hypothetical protein